jgi:hypothetical protein
MRHKAIEVLLAATAGAYQTTLLTYMIQRDLFPSIMKVREKPVSYPASPRAFFAYRFRLANRRGKTPDSLSKNP